MPQFLVRFSLAVSMLSWAALVLLLTGCSTTSTTGHLGLVTTSSVDSALLLRDGTTYRVLGSARGATCTETSKNTEPRDNFAEAVQVVLSNWGGDALIDVTIETHRGNYFPFVFPIPLFLGVIGVPFPNILCTTVWGTAIEFLEEPDCSPCLVTRKVKTLSKLALTVDSLQPTLQWEPWKGKPYEELGQDVTYQLKVWGLRKGRSDSREGETVYEQEGLTDTSHQIKIALNPSTHYFWAVRAQYRDEDDQVQFTTWSDLSEGRERFGLYDFHFWTPSVATDGIRNEIKS